MLTTAIASQKGGTGKTTTAISLAAGLAHKGKRVLLIDMDSQANASKVLLHQYQQLKPEGTVVATMLQKQPLQIYPTTIPTLYIVPSNYLLSNTDIQFAQDRNENEYQKAQRLKSQLDPLQGYFDYVFIDCPPALSWLTVNAFTAADEVIIIVSPGYFELDSIGQISDTISATMQAYNPHLRLRGLLFTMTDSTINTANSYALLKRLYGEGLLQTTIPRNTDLRDAHFSKVDIFRYNPAARGAVAYSRLLEELYGL